MEANELRIGNYFVGYSNYVQQWEIESFVLLSEGVEVDEIIRSFIPLTEDWLLKFGFKKTNGYGFKIFGNWLQKEDGSYWYNVNGNFIEIKYVHELQNLYFALTGKELNLC